MRAGRRSIDSAAAAFVLAAAILAAAWVAAPGGADDARAQSADTRPNVLFFLTDDQTLADMEAMPRTKVLIGANGATFRRAYSSYPLCCPSRATLLTGRYAHNHGVLSNTPPLGGYYRLAEQHTLPVWLQAAGYHTAHIGKLPNGYTGAPGGGTTIPLGWDGPNGDFYGFLSGSGGYVNYSLNENGTVVDYGKRPTDYQTDLYGAKAIEVIDRQFAPGAGRQPLYMEMAFFAPHDPSRPADRHRGTFASHVLPRPPGFDEPAMGDKPPWLARQAGPLDQATIDSLTASHQLRLESLQAVDEVIQLVLERMSAHGELENTYIVFTSDNGYFQGQHRIHQGKYLPHEPSSHVPLLVRGPGIGAYSEPGELVTNADFVPTVLEVTGAQPSQPVDGRSLLPFARRPELRSRRPLLFETSSATGLPTPDGLRAGRPSGVPNLEQDRIATLRQVISAPSYRAIRTRRYLLIRYVDGAVELYDMAKDPAQLRSVHALRRYKPVKRWLTRRLGPLSQCAGATCTRALNDPPKPQFRQKGKRKRRAGG